MKKTLAILLAVIMVLSLLSGCGNSKTDTNSGTNTDNTTTTSPDNSTSNDTEPSANDSRVLHVAASGDTGTLYPLALSGGFVMLQYAFYDPLWTQLADGTKVMLLAESYEPADESGIRFTLKLRQNVQFNNGNPLTADDVMFTMEMCKDDPRFYLNVGYVDFEKTKVVDDYTIDVWYTTTSYTQENSFTQMMIMDKESFDIETLSTNPIGTGPYICTDYVVNSHVTAVANPNYWGGEPAIKNIEFKVISEASQIINALEIGDIDYVNGVSVDELDYVKDLGYDIRTTFGAYANTALFSFAGALSSKEARYAVSHAMDRESMSYLMYKGLSSVPGYPTSEHCTDYEERFSNMNDLYSKGYDVELAKQYAEESGLVGKTLKIITNGMEAYNDVAAIIKENLAAIGVNSEIVSYDSATYFSVVMDESNFDIALFYLSAPSQLACDIMCAYLDFIPLGWYDDAREDYRTLCNQILSEMDDQKRGDLTYQLLELFLEYDPWYAICESVSAAAVSPDIGGMRSYLAGNIYYQDLYWN